MKNNLSKKNRNANSYSVNKLVYNGIVTVSIKNKNKTLSTKTYHNNGGEELFKFLCQSISQVPNHENGRPNKIKLFLNNADRPDLDTSNITSLSTCITANEIICSYGELPDSETSNQTWYATLHFTVPNVMITGNTINEIRLYPQNTTVDDTISGDFSKYCADFKFTKTTDEGLVWDPIILSGKNTYNLVISWSLSFTNN